MCVQWIGEWFETAADMIALKVVRHVSGSYFSANPVADRYAQWGDSEDRHSLGTSIEYPVDELIHDDGEWGFYCFENSPRNRGHFVRNRDGYEERGKRIMEVLIPKGTQIRWGEKNGFTTLNIKSLKVIGEMQYVC